MGYSRLIEINKTNSSEYSSQSVVYEEVLGNLNIKKEKYIQQHIILFICIISLFVSGSLIFNMTSFFPLFVDKKYNKEFKQISALQISFCFSAYEIACVAATKFNSITISKMGRKNSILFGLSLLAFANVGIGSLYYLHKD